MTISHSNEKQYREAPANIEAEQALLGSLLVNNAAYHRISDLITAEHFFDPVHKRIFEAISYKISANRVANPITVKDALGKEERVGDMSTSEYAALLARSAVSIINAPDYAAAIYDLYCRRELISLGTDMVNVAYDAPLDLPPMEVIDQASTRLLELAEGNAAVSGEPAYSGAYLAHSYVNMVTQDPEKRSGRGVPIVLKEIEAVLSESHFEAENIYGVLSSSGEGKSAVAVEISYHALSQGHPVCFFSFEQTGLQITAQIIAQEKGIEVRRQKTGDLSGPEYERCVLMSQKLASMPFEVKSCDSRTDTTEKMHRRAKGFLKKHSNGKTPLFIFDGAIPPEYEDRHSDPGSKARGIGNKLKAMMKATKAAGIVILDRDSEGMKRPNPRPIPSDIFGKQMALKPYDAILYIYRAEEHRRRQLESARDEGERIRIEASFTSAFPSSVGLEGTAEIGSIKVRFGQVGIKKYVKFVPQFTKYESIWTPQDEQEVMF